MCGDTVAFVGHAVCVVTVARVGCEARVGRVDRAGCGDGSVDGDRLVGGIVLIMFVVVVVVFVSKVTVPEPHEMGHMCMSLGSSDISKTRMLCDSV